MEINISQIKGFNIVSIDGNEILNVDSYSIRSTRSGETELVLTIKLPDCGFSEISLGGTAEEVASEQAGGSAGGCWHIKTYKAGAAEAEERLYDPGEIEHGTPVIKRDFTEAEKQMAETVVRYMNQKIRDGGERLV